MATPKQHARRLEMLKKLHDAQRKDDQGFLPRGEKIQPQESAPTPRSEDEDEASAVSAPSPVPEKRRDRFPVRTKKAGKPNRRASVSMVMEGDQGARRRPSMADDWSAFGTEDLARAERFLREVQPRLEDLRDERKDAKKEADEARRQLRALLKSLSSGAEEAELGTRERVAALERRQARQDRRFDVATERARRCLQIKEEVEKLKRFIEQKLQEQRNRELVAARLLELKSLVNTGEKEIRSSASEILSVIIHYAEELQQDIELRHPAVLVSVVDVTTGCFLRKGVAGCNAVLQNERTSLRDDHGTSEIGSAPYKTGPVVPFILPILTFPYDLRPSAVGGWQGGRGAGTIRAGLKPCWEEEVVVDEDFDHFDHEKVMFFFELVDFRVGDAAVNAARRGEGAWKHIAWAFFRPRIQGLEEDDGTQSSLPPRRGPGWIRRPRIARRWGGRGSRVAAGPSNSFYRRSGIEGRVTLQLYKYHDGLFSTAARGASLYVHARDTAKKEAGALAAAESDAVELTHSDSWTCHAYGQWLLGPYKWHKYQSCLHITLDRRLRPAQQTLPCSNPLHATVIHRDKEGAGREDSWVVPARVEVTVMDTVTKGNWLLFGLPGGQRQHPHGVHVTWSVPGLISEQGEWEEGVERKLRFEAMASLEPDTRLWFRFVDGYGIAMPGALEKLPAQVEKRRAFMPWQEEKETLLPEQLDSVSKLRLKRKTTEEGPAPASAPKESVNVARLGRKWDGASGQWCRVPNSVLHSVPTDGEGCTCAAFSSCGTFLAVAVTGPKRHQRILVVNTATGAVVLTLDAHHDLVYDLQWPKQRRAVAEGRALPPLLSASADGTVKVWSLERREALTTAYHPAFVYCAAFFRNPARSSGAQSEQDLQLELGRRREGPTGATASEDNVGSETVDLDTCSHVVTGCFDHHIRVWQTCDTRRAQPSGMQAHLAFACIADVLYAETAAADQWLFLVAFEPRAAVRAGEVILLSLPGFKLLPSLQARPGGNGELRSTFSTVNKYACRRSPLDRQWRPADPGDGQAAVTAGVTDSMVKLTVKEAGGGLVLLVQAQAFVPEGVPWAVVVPDRTGIVMPWHKAEEDELFEAVTDALQGPGSAQTLTDDQWHALARSLETPRCPEELQDRWESYRKGEAGLTPSHRSAECLAFVPLSSGDAWPVTVRLQGAVTAVTPASTSTNTPLHTPLSRVPSGGTASATPRPLESPKPSPDSEFDIGISFTPNVALQSGDVIDIFLPGFRSGPTFLGSVSTPAGNPRLVHTAYNDPGQDGTLVPKAWEVDLALKTARLHLEVHGHCEANLKIGFQLSDLFGYPAREAGILPPPNAKRESDGTLRPAGGTTFSAVRPNAEDLSFAMELPRDIQPGDEIVLQLPRGFSGSSADGLGVCSIKSLAHQLLVQSPEQRASTSGRRWARRWGQATCVFDEKKNTGEITFRATGHTPQDELVVLTVPRYQPALPDEFLPITWPKDVTDNGCEGVLRCNPWWRKSKLLLQLSGDHAALVNSLAVAHHSEFGRDPQVYSGDGAGMVLVWNVGSVKDTAAAATADRWALQITRRKTLQLEESRGVPVACVRVDPAGRLLAVLSMDNHVRVFTTHPLEIRYRLGGVLCRQANVCMKCSFSQDGQYLASGSEDGKVWVWAMDTGRAVRNVVPDAKYRTECSAVVWSPAERILACCSMGRRAPVLFFAYDAHAAGGSTGAEDLIQEALQGRWGDLNEAFARLDTDGDHKLQWREFKQGFEEMEMELSEAELRGAFTAMATRPPLRSEEPVVIRP